jgi:hypothetical protein
MAEALSTLEPNAVIADAGLVYCRFPNGEIQACDAQPMELMKKINRGITPLVDYGQFGSSAYYMDHPFEPLWQGGGAREMAVWQIVQLGYHLRPPLVPTCERHVGDAKDHLSHVGTPGASSRKAQGCWVGARPVHFPQLDGQVVPEAPEACEFCGRDDFATEQALKQHQDVMHNDRRQQQQLGEAIVAGLQRTGVVGGASQDAQAIAAAVAATLQALGYGAAPPPRRVAPEDDDEDEPAPPPDDDDGGPEPPAPAPPKRPLSERQREALARARAAKRIPITTA